MAEYYKVLKKAIGELDSNRAESRRTVYRQFRHALITELKGVASPRNIAEISARRIELDEAIRKVERESVTNLKPQDWTPKNVLQRASPRAASFRGPARPAATEHVTARVRAEPGQHSFTATDLHVTRDRGIDHPPPPVPKLEGSPPNDGDPRAPAIDFRKRLLLSPTSKAVGYRDGDDQGRSRKREARQSRSSLLLTGLIATIILVAGTVAWSNRAMIGQMIMALDDDAASLKVVAPINPSPHGSLSPATPVAPAVAAPALLADSGSKAALMGLASGEANPASPATPLSVSAADKAAASSSPVQQIAVLHEESVKGGSSAVVASINAGVTWRYVENGANGPTIEADLQVPARRIKIKLIIHKNADSSIPASYLIELMIDAPADLPGKGIQQISQILMKPTEEARGQPLAGAEAKIVDGFFWIALSTAEADVSANLALLRNRSWFDLPFVYETGQRATLTFGKGFQGDQVFQKALAAWTTG